MPAGGGDSMLAPVFQLPTLTDGRLVYGTGGTVASAAALVYDSAAGSLAATKLIAQQSGGVAGTDEVQVYHDGARGFVECKSGELRLLTAGDRVRVGSGNFSLAVDCLVEMSGNQIGFNFTGGINWGDSSLARSSGAGVLVTATPTTAVPLTVKGAASQSANLQEWQDSAGTVLAAFKSNAAWSPASLADASAANGTVYYSTDAAKLVYKDTGGVVNNLY